MAIFFRISNCAAPGGEPGQMLAEKQPATFVIFDLLETEQGKTIMSAPLSERRVALEDFWKKHCSR